MASSSIPVPPRKNFANFAKFEEQKAWITELRRFNDWFQSLRLYPIQPQHLVITGRGETDIQITDCVYGGSVFIPTDVAVAIFPADLIFELLHQRSIKQGLKRVDVVDQEEEEEEEYSAEPKSKRSKKKSRSEKTGKVNPYNVYCESFPSGTFGGSDYLKKRAEIGLRWKALSKEEQQPFRDEAKRRNDLQTKEEAGVAEVAAEE